MVRTVVALAGMSGAVPHGVVGRLGLPAVLVALVARVLMLERRTFAEAAAEVAAQDMLVPAELVERVDFRVVAAVAVVLVVLVRLPAVLAVLAPPGV